MKEFIDKLIGRLEESVTFPKMNRMEKRVGTRQTQGFVLGVRNSVQIVNELAEEYNNGWIPCSERLPNKEEYLKNDGRFIVTDGNRVYQSIYDIYTHHYFRTLKFYNFGAGEKSRYEIDNCVIAWMPLPQPYIEQQKELSSEWKQQTMSKFERVE